MNKFSFVIYLLLIVIGDENIKEKQLITSCV